EGVEVVSGVAEPEIAVPGDREPVLPFEAAEALHAAGADLDRERIEVLRLDDPDGEPGGGARDVRPLEHGHVRDAELGQRDRRAEAERPAADDGDGGHAAARPTSRSSPFVRSRTEE